MWVQPSGLSLSVDGVQRASVRVPSWTRRGGTYVLYLESKNQKITSPVLTVTR